MKTLRNIQEGFYKNTRSGVVSHLEQKRKDIISFMADFNHDEGNHYRLVEEDNDILIDVLDYMFLMLRPDTNNYNIYNKLDKLPYRFTKNCPGDFYLSNFSNLSTLEGMPEIYKGSLNLSGLNIKGFEKYIKRVNKTLRAEFIESLNTLKDMPVVGESIIIGYTDIKNLKGLPKTCKGDLVIINNNKLEDISDISQNISGSLDLSNNRSLDLINCPVIPNSIRYMFYFYNTVSNKHNNTIIEEIADKVKDRWKDAIDVADMDGITTMYKKYLFLKDRSY